MVSFAQVAPFFAPLAADTPVYTYVTTVRRAFSVFIGVGLGLGNRPTDNFMYNGFPYRMRECFRQTDAAADLEYRLRMGRAGNPAAPVVLPTRVVLTVGDEVQTWTDPASQTFQEVGYTTQEGDEVLTVANVASALTVELFYD